MSAEKARFIRSAYNYAGAVEVKIGNARNSETVGIDELKRPELIKLAALLGCKSPTGKWAGLPNTDIITTIDHKILVEGHGLRVPGKRTGNTPPNGGETPTGSGDAAGGEDGGTEGEGEGEGEGSGDESGSGEPDVSKPAGDSEGDSGTEGEEGNDDGEFEPEPFTPDPEDLIQPEDDVAKQIEKLTKQQEDKAAHDEKQEAAKAEHEEAKAEAEKAKAEAEAAKAEAEKKEEEKRKAAKAEGEDKAKEKVAKAKAAKAAMPTKHHKVLPQLIDALVAGHHVYLVGPPGTGKSFMTEQAAALLGREYGAISCGPQTPESRLWGYMDAGGRYNSTTFSRLYGKGSAMFNFDEVDNGHTGINTTVNQSLSGDGANFPDGWVTMGDDFNAVATANTWGQGATSEHMGRNPQDSAFLDRFTFLKVDIDEDVEEMMVHSTGLVGTDAVHWLNTIRTIRSNVESAKLKIVVSPRAAKAGAELLMMGWKQQDVLDARVLKGTTEDRRRRILEGVK